MSRRQRTKEYRNKVEKQWKQKYWSFIEENLDKDLYCTFIPTSIY